MNTNTWTQKAKFLAAVFFAAAHLALVVAQPTSKAAQKVDAWGAFYSASESGNLLAARQAIELARENGKPFPAVGICHRILESKHFDRLSPILGDLLKTNASAILGEDSVFGRMTAVHVQWLDKSGYLSPQYASRYLRIAAGRPKQDVVHALLQSKAASEFSDDTKQHALLAATSMRLLENVEELLQSGAQPDKAPRLVSDPSQAISPVDLAAKAYWIAGLKRLDVNGKHKEFIANFHKEFPAAKNSPLVGIWSVRGASEFVDSQISFGADATGTMSGYRVPFVWRISGQDVTIIPVLGKGLLREQAIHLTYDSQKGELVKEKEPAQRYHKVVKSR